MEPLNPWTKNELLDKRGVKMMHILDLSSISLNTEGMDLSHNVQHSD